MTLEVDHRNLLIRVNRALSVAEKHQEEFNEMQSNPLIGDLAGCLICNCVACQMVKILLGNE
jgi:hypothetical protein